MLLEYIILASGSNFLLLAIVLLLKKTPNNLSKRILFTLSMLMTIYSSLAFFHYAALENKLYSQLVYYIPIDRIILLSVGPCLFFYILSLLNKPVSVLNRKLLIHLIPFIFYILFNIYFITFPSSERIDWLINDFYTGTWETDLLNLVFYLQIIIYLIVSYAIVRKQLKQTVKIESGEIQFDILWLKTYLIISLLFMTFSFLLSLIIANERANIIIGQLGMDVQFTYLLFRWLLHDDAALTAYKPELAIKKNIVKLSSRIIDVQLQALITFMEERKPYLDENCSIQQVAKQTGILAYQLSNTLNIGLQKSFPDFINEYRIREAKDILLSKEAQAVTIEHIAAECGFGSKCTFNRAFKKHCNNLTPTEFIRQHKSVES